MLKRVIPYAHTLLKELVQVGDTVIDATCGNGHDTLVLSECVAETGTVYGFDIQAQALEETRRRLTVHNQPERLLIQDSHANLLNHLKVQDYHNITAAIFNLGYLPGGDKSIITTPQSTLDAVQVILEHLKKGGLLILVIYHGHEGGSDERDQLLTYVQSLEQKDYDVLQYGFVNQKNNPPFIIAIEKKRMLIY